MGAPKDLQNGHHTRSGFVKVLGGKEVDNVRPSAHSGEKGLVSESGWV